MKKSYQMWKTPLLVIVALFILVLTGCGTHNSSNTVRVGINASDEPIWKEVQKQVKKEGITIKITDFSDYNQPNTALAQGGLDINAYQHRYFLDAWNKSHHTHIVPIGDTIIEPLALYSHKVTKVSQLKKNAKITIPNDTSNEARALQLLASAGLITLKDKKLPSTKDITSNRLHLKFTTLDAAQTARSLDDVDAAVVNGNVASDAKLNPKKAVFCEKITQKSKPWINVIAADSKDKNNKNLKKVVKAFQSKATAKVIKKVYGGNAIPAWNLNLK
ncbi:MetQ/NlpA family ABC transporter substrate-binding protein [Companilactobacillus mishanensis]|uniref:Lipoprotein n=1 Tax=Companilactobacillus mishanensis TaxID=2486008 RepID=A0ABW9P834_9LACO|nr:MetQ/NlpA family ABC transporter substrate-binding protein [Companilactobacillus mishanensis]MQS45439.1 MetQ/NlpA family ABC transporter substrate-binding protein [Companilactobacillus mishanensis]